MKLRTLAWSVAFLSFVAIALSAFPSPLLAQTIQVTSATPPAAPQGTINLNVVVGGNGFAKGAKAAFYQTGTTNPAGVSVNSTAFNSKSQVTANINIADAATITSFDVVVTNTDGRSGKGTKLFQVTVKGTPLGCATLGAPSGFSLVTELNYVNSSGAPQYGPSLGGSVRVRPVVLTAGGVSKTVLVAAVGTSITTGKLEIFILDPATGNVLDGTVIVGSQVQPHITVVTNADAHNMAVGDVDGNGIPDFALGAPVVVTMGSEDSNGILTYSPPIALTAGSNGPAISSNVAMGNLDGSPIGEDVIVGAAGGGSSHLAGVVHIYQFNGSTANPGFNLIGTVNDPLPNTKNDDKFGYSVATGNVTGNSINLIVGAPYASVAGVGGAGRVFVFPEPLSSGTNFTLTAPPVANENLGWQVGSGTLSGTTASDVIATTGWSGSTINVSIFSGPINANRTTPSFTFQPSPGLTGGWATHIDIADINGDGWTDVLVGGPNANPYQTCNYGPGSAQLYLSSVTSPGPQWTLNLFQTPVLQSDFMGFGFGVAAVPALPALTGFTPVILVGEHGRDLGGVTGAGQVYIYKKN